MALTTRAAPSRRPIRIRAQRRKPTEARREADLTKGVNRELDRSVVLLRDFNRWMDDLIGPKERGRADRGARHSTNFLTSRRHSRSDQQCPAGHHRAEHYDNSSAAWTQTNSGNGRATPGTGTASTIGHDAWWLCALRTGHGSDWGARRRATTESQRPQPHPMGSKV